MIYWTLFPSNWAFKPKKEHRSDKRDPYNRRPIAIQIFFCIITILPQSLDSVHTSKSNSNISVKSNTKANKGDIVKQLTWANILCIIIQRLDII